jgi:aspartyl-tRNA(Asn)/glutamyl-tRNA(Gln) amidotransferase subunit A
VNLYLENIDKTSHMNIYLEVYAEEAKKRAVELDTKYKNDTESAGALYGMVISIKDVICYKDHVLSAGSKMLDGFVSQFSATAINRILAEDAIIIGRTNCDEFAMGSSNENSFYGPVLNPCNKEYIPGGSSGGTAASVAAETCLLALGSDTGGSVRQPATFCGKIGFKPSYGRISRYGLIAYASSFDQIGMVANTIDDIAIVYDLTSGIDGKDGTLIDEGVHPKFLELSEKKPRVAYFESIFESPELDEFVRLKCKEFVNKLEAQSFNIDEVPFELLDFVVPCYYVLAMAEASSNLSRYEGVRYGHQSSEKKDLKDFYKTNRTEGFGKEVKRRIMMGTFVLSSGYYDAYYEKAQKVRNLITKEINTIFSKYDVIILPSSPQLPWKLGDKNKKLTDIYLADIFTVIANICGIPAVSIPLGHNKEGLYAGMQLMSAKYNEASLFNFSKQIQNWHRN